jgi:DNA-directed RNA polymerase subunit alpha
MRKFKEAAEALQPVSDQADGAFFLGLCLVELKEYAAAVKSFAKAAKSGQDAFVCAMAEAEALRLAGNREEALARIRSHQKSHDGEAELHYQKGRCLEEALEYEAAMEAYERAVELDPQHVSALFRLGYWHDLRGNDDLALDYYEKGAAVRPAHANLLVNLGLMYEDHGEYQKAAQVYQRILAVDPTHPRVAMYNKDAVASLDMYYDEAMERRQHRTAAMLRVNLSEFDLSTRAKTALEKMNIRTLGDLARLNEDDLEESQNFGEASLAELRELLESKGLHFGYGRPEPASAPAAALTSPEQADVLAKSVSDMDLSVRSLKCMRTLEIETVSDLIQKTEKELLQCPNFGQTSLNEIKRKLNGFGLSLKTRP